MIFALLAILILIILLIYSMSGRTGHMGLAKLREYAYAHRGLHGPGVPENSLKAFQMAVEAGYGAELDVHLLADGNLAVIHDYSLKRTAGADVQIESLTFGELKKYRLEGTDETIPELSQVLTLFQGKTPLIVELKTANNASVLTEKVCKMLDSFHVEYCIESFDPQCIRWLRKHRPDIIRGQLVENYMRTKPRRIPVFARFVLSWQLCNVLTKPDFIAYCYADRKHLSNHICRRLWKLQGVSWTLRTQEQYDIAVKEHWIPIFEGIKP